MSAHPSFPTSTEQFYKAFPYYLSIGMTYDQYWNDNPCLTRYYREADEMRNERRNQDMWIQGMYIYEALCDVAPIMNGFAKKGTKPHPYTDHPYALTEKQRKREEEEKARKNAEKGKRYFEAFMARQNREVPTSEL